MLVKRRNPPALPIPTNRHGPETTREGGATADKLNAIIVPTVKFEEASIQEAVEFLRQSSREFDPAKTGVNFILRVSNERLPKISLDLRDVPLGVAAKAVADLGGLRMRVQPWTVTLTSGDFAQFLETRIFSVPPDFLCIRTL